MGLSLITRGRQVHCKWTDSADFIHEPLTIVLHIPVGGIRWTTTSFSVRRLYGIKQSSLTAITSVLTQRNVCKMDHDLNKLQYYRIHSCVIYFQPILKKQLYKLDAQKIIIINPYIDMNKEMLLIDTYLKTNLNGLGIKSRNCKHIE